MNGNGGPAASSKTAPPKAEARALHLHLRPLWPVCRPTWGGRPPPREELRVCHIREWAGICLLTPDADEGLGSTRMGNGSPAPTTTTSRGLKGIYTLSFTSSYSCSDLPRLHPDTGSALRPSPARTPMLQHTRSAYPLRLCAVDVCTHLNR